MHNREKVTNSLNFDDFPPKMIVADHLSKSFGRFTAVNDVSFRVNKGEIVGFLGPNGAGKTTTLRMLTGYIPPTSGTASIAGHDILKEPLEARRHLGYLPEHVPLYDDQRVTEYLKFRARLKGVSGKKIWETVARVTELCGLTEKRRKMIRTLSKGYRQRVGLADALLGSPDLLILDEPTNGLDPNQIRQIRELVKNLAEHHTIILSTHILSEVEMICNKVIIVDQGRVKAADSPTALTENLRAAGKISVEIKHPNLEEVIAALSELPHIKKVFVPEPDSDSPGLADPNWLNLMIRADVNTDTREHVAKLCSDKHWPLRHLYRHTPTLEDVFVELTRKD